jgi:hypothetical protein
MEFRKLIILAALALVLGAVSCGGGSNMTSPLTIGDQTGATRGTADFGGETVYLVNYSPDENEDATLYTVSFDAGLMQAVLEEVITMDTFEGAHIGATPDGSRIYAIGKPDSRIGYYDVDAGTWHIVADGQGNPVSVRDNGDIVPNIPVVGFSPDGDLYVASQDTEQLYRVNEMTGDAENLGYIYTDQQGTLDISGADLTFDAYGNMYLYTNGQSQGAPYGLYELDITGNDVFGEHVSDFQPQGYSTTGLAVADNGEGDLLVSETTSDVVAMLDMTTLLYDEYELYFDGEPFSHTWGDMTVGSFGEEYEECPEDGMYLTNVEDGVSVLYHLGLDDTNEEAVTTYLETLTGFESAHIGTTVDGSYVWAVNHPTGQLGYYDVDADTWNPLDLYVTDNGDPVTGIVAVAFSTENEMYVASSHTDSLYRVDTDTGEAENLGTIWTYCGEQVFIEGADLAFDVVGNLYLYTNGGDGEPGLYWVDYNVMPVQATYLFTDPDAEVEIRGVALRWNGAGDVVISDDTENVVTIINRDDWSWDKYPLVDEYGNPFEHTTGDMAVKMLDEFEFENPPLSNDSVFLTNHPDTDVDSDLYRVRFADSTEEAVLFHLATLEGFKDAHIAVTSDNEHVYAIDGKTSKIGHYDVMADTWTILTDGSGSDLVVMDGNSRVKKIYQLAFDMGGTLYVTSAQTHSLYTVDLNTGAAVNLGQIMGYDVDDGYTYGPLEIKGADFAFDTFGNMYLYTNKSANGADRGLYWVDYNASPLVAAYLYDEDDELDIRGAALRFSGNGDLLLSDGADDEILQYNRDNGVIHYYTMLDEDGALFNHRTGDMASPVKSQSCGDECEYPELERTLYVDGQVYAGTVHVTPDCEEGLLYVEIDADEGWLLHETYLYVGTEPPTGPADDFNYSHLCLDGAESDTFVVDVMNDIDGFECGDPLYLSTAAMLLSPYGGDDDPMWAESVVDYEQGTRRDGDPVAANRSDPNAALGAPDGGAIGSFFSLGFDLTPDDQYNTGWLELGWNGYIFNGDADDVTTIEVTWNQHNYYEEAAVYVSDCDGEWHFCGIASNQDPGSVSVVYIPEEVTLAGTVLLVDNTNPEDHGGSGDGYDVDAVGVSHLTENGEGWADGEWYEYGTYFVLNCQ